jgi:hypothetical protein
VDAIFLGESVDLCVRAGVRAGVRVCGVRVRWRSSFCSASVGMNGVGRAAC